MKIKINGVEKDYGKEEKKEIIIHDWKAKKEVAVTGESASKQYFKPEKKKLPRYKVRRGTPAINPMVLVSVISAIMIGILIGLVFLKMMMKDPEQNNGDARAGAVNSRGQVVLPAVSLYILQQGVYQNEDSVKKVKKVLIREGEPAGTIKDGENYRIFVAVADSESTAKALQKKNGYTGMWPTKLDMPEKVIQNLTEDEKIFLESVYPFYEKLVREGSNSYLQGKSYRVNTDELQEMMVKIRELKNVKQEPIKELYYELQKAYDGVHQFLEDRSEDNWKQAQKHLIRFVSGYYLL